MKTVFWINLKLTSKWKHVSEKKSIARDLKDSYNLRNKQMKNVSSHQSPCRWVVSCIMVAQPFCKFFCSPLLMILSRDNIYKSSQTHHILLQICFKCVVQMLEDVNIFPYKNLAKI